MSRSTEIKSAFAGAEAELLERMAALEEKNARLEAENTQLKEEKQALCGQLRLKEAESLTDELTQLPNVRALNIAVDRNVSRYDRGAVPASILFADVDHFKFVNDALGHPIGDLVLQKLAEKLKELLKRATDLVARYGGEEFVSVLEDCAMDEAAARAQIIRKAVQDMEIELPEGYQLTDDYHKRNASERPQTEKRADGRLILKITISVGVVSITSANDTAESLKANADKALYAAKDNGRNCVCCFYAEDNIVPMERGEVLQFVLRPNRMRNREHSLAAAS